MIMKNCKRGVYVKILSKSTGQRIADLDGDREGVILYSGDCEVTVGTRYEYNPNYDKDNLDDMCYDIFSFLPIDLEFMGRDIYAKD